MYWYKFYITFNVSSEFGAFNEVINKWITGLLVIEPTVIKFEDIPAIYAAFTKKGWYIKPTIYKLEFNDASTIR